MCSRRWTWGACVRNCAAGGCSRLVAVSRLSNVPPEVASLPQLGDAWSINLEAVLAQQPDLVIAWADGTPPDRVARLQKLGLRVVWLRANTLDSVAGAIIAGLLVGWLESIAVGYFGGKARDLVPYVVVLAILMVRPYGLMGTRDIERL